MRRRDSYIYGFIIAVSLIANFFCSHDFVSAKEPTGYELSQDDAWLLMQVAQAEAGNQGPDGLWLVMSVVINRVNDDSFPDTVSEVVYQPCQFATPSKYVTDDCYEALERITAGDIAPMIVAFETADSEELDKWFDAAFTYRDHKFYTKKED